MAEIIKQSWVEHIEEYRLSFDIHGPGWGYSFECDKDGHVDATNFSEAALENYQMCVMSGVKPYIRDQSRNYRHPTIIACDECGWSIHLTGFTNTCPNCELFGVEVDYNMSGQRLAPREQWGEETGETAGDILRGDFDYDD